MDRAGRIIVPLMPPYCKMVRNKHRALHERRPLDKSFGHNGATSLPLDVAIAARVTSRGIFVYGTMHGIGGTVALSSSFRPKASSIRASVVTGSCYRLAPE